MKMHMKGGLLIIIALLGQGCATTAAPKKMATKAKAKPDRHQESYALVDESSKVDMEIVKRGNKVRGLSEY